MVLNLYRADKMKGNTRLSCFSIKRLENVKKVYMIMPQKEERLSVKILTAWWNCYCQLDLNIHPNTCIHMQFFGGQILSLPLGAGLFSNHSACFKMQLLPNGRMVTASQQEKLVLPARKQVFTSTFLTPFFSCLFLVSSHQNFLCISA